MPALYEHLGFSVDPDQVGKKLQRALASLICVDHGEKPCKSCVALVSRQVKPVARFARNAAYGERGRSVYGKIAGQVSLGAALELFFQEAGLNVPEASTPEDEAARDNAIADALRRTHGRVEAPVQDEPGEEEALAEVLPGDSLGGPDGGPALDESAGGAARPRLQGRPDQASEGSGGAGEQSSGIDTARFQDYFDAFGTHHPAGS